MPVLSSGQKVPALFLTGNNVFPGNLIRNKLQNEQSGRRYLQPFSGKLILSKKTSRKRPCEFSEKCSGNVSYSCQILSLMLQ